MKEVIHYQAEDGTVFVTAKDAAKRDAEVAAVRKALEPLGPLYRGGELASLVDFLNGKGFVQHQVADVETVRLALVELSLPKLSSTLQSVAKTQHTSWYAYVFDNMEFGSPLQRAWMRLNMIDSLGREWGQPYFAKGGGEPIELPRPVSGVMW